MASSFSSQQNTQHTKSIRDLVAPNPPANGKPVYYDSETTTLLRRTPTCMNYVSADTVKVTVKRDEQGNDSVTTGAIWQETAVWVENGRLRSQGQQRLNLHANGFELVEQDSIPHDIDFLSRNQVLDEYYPHCEQLLERHLGEGVTVKAFDHNVRMQESNGETQKPLGLVHGDYTTTSGPRRLQLLAQAPKVNDVWRERLGEKPLLDKAVVDECLAKSLPLACIDAATHDSGDLRVLEIHYADRVGENFLAAPSPNHKWYYFPQMSYNEAMLIKQWDSAGDLATDQNNNLSTLSIHSAFLDPSSSPAAGGESPPRPRKSIEVRCVAIWDAAADTD